MRRHSSGTTDVKNVLFVQGGGEGTHDSWDNRLVASLEQSLAAGFAIHYPRMPDEANPDPATWKKAISRALEKVAGPTILVAHSIGAAILLDHLAAIGYRRPLAGVFLVAPPFIGDGGWPNGDLPPTNRVAAELPEGVPLFMYFGGDDETVPLSHSRLFQSMFPHATIRRLRGRDHQLGDDLEEVARDIQGLDRLAQIDRQRRTR